MMVCLARLLWLLLEALRLIGAQPGEVPEVVDEAIAIVERYQGAPPDELNASAALQAIGRRWLEIEDEAAAKFPFGGEPATIDYSLLYGEESPYTPEQAQEYAKASAWALDQLKGRGIFDEIDRLRDSRRVVSLRKSERSYTPEVPLLLWVRKPVRACVARMAAATETGDSAAYVAAAEQGLALSRFVLHQFGMVSRLVGSAGSNLVCRRIRDDIMRGRVSGDAAAALLAALRRQWDVPARGIVIDSMRLDWRQLVAKTHTDDGQADGWIVLASVADVSAWGNALGVLLAPRAESQRRGMELLDRMQTVADTPTRSRAEPTKDLHEWIDGLGPRYWIVRRHSEAILPGWSKWLETDDQVLMERAGTLTMLAIEAYRARHGRLPESLEQLAPEILDVLPPDPHTGAPLRLLVTDPAEPEAGKGYTLYSAWTDGEDNRGKRVSRAGGVQAEIAIGWRAGFDFIINDAPAGGGDGD